MTKRTWFICVSLMAVVTLAASSSSSSSVRPTGRCLTGRVVAGEDGAALDGVMIWIDGGLVFGPTATDGRFCIADVPATSFRLNARRMGFVPGVIDVPPGRGMLVIRLTIEPIKVTAAEVHGELHAEQQANGGTVPLERVSPRRIENAIGAGGDVLRSLQTLPSVAVANDFSSQLYIRGGGPEQNAVLLDGVPVYLPYRALSVFSSFSPLLVERAELYPGGFGVQFGDRLSAVLDITYRRGRTSARKSEVSANTIATQALTEGPLGTGGTSYILSARRTHYDLLLNRNSGENGMAYPSFYDLYAKVSGHVGQSTFDLFGWYGAETMNLTQQAHKDDRRSFAAQMGEHLHSGAAGLKLRYAGSPRAVHTITTAISLDSRTMALGGDFDATYNETRRLAMVHEQSHFQPAAGVFLTTGVGGSLTQTGTDYQAQGLHDAANEERSPDGFDYRPAQPAFDYDDRALKTFAYGQLEFTPVPQWRWVVGGRADRNFSFTGVDISPRTSMSVQLSKTWVVRGAYGVYYQSPSLEAFIEKNYFPDLSAHRELRSEKAIHHLLGMAGNFGNGAVLNLEGYYKRLSDLICDKNDGTFTPFNGGRGLAWGIEVSARLSDQPEQRLSGDVSYTLAHSSMRTPYDAYPLRYDQRHTLAVTGQYRLGAGWQTAAKYRWGSGFPYTDVIDRKPGVSNPAETPWVPIWGPTNGARLPQYARLDLRVTKGLHWGRTAWEAYIEVLNVLGRKNVFRYEWDREYLTRHARYQLPRLPNIGLAVKF